MLPALFRGTRTAALAALPLRAPLPPAAKKGSRDKGPRRPGKLSHDTATGCALLKGEADPPIKPDEEYPAWLFELMAPAPSSKELLRAYEQTGLTMEEMKRLWRLQNKARIVEGNVLSKK